MKNVKISINFSNLFKYTSKEVTRLQVYTKTLAATFGGLFYLNESPYTICIVVTGFITDSLLHFVSIENIESKEDVNTK